MDLSTVLLILQALPTLISAIMSLMSELEIIFKGQPKTGEIKKQICMNTIKANINNENLWPNVEGAFSKAINMTSKIQFNSSGKDPEPAPVVEV